MQTQGRATDSAFFVCQQMFVFSDFWGVETFNVYDVNLFFDSKMRSEEVFENHVVLVLGTLLSPS